MRKKEIFGSQEIAGKMVFNEGKKLEQIVNKRDNLSCDSLADVSFT